LKPRRQKHPKSPLTMRRAQRMYEKSTTITHWSDDEDDADTHKFYTSLTHAIDDVVDHANETETPVKLTINDDGTKVTFELVSA
jgi:hypothetical protein